MADMRDQLARLYEYQQLETGIASRARARAQLDDGEAMQARLDEAKRTLADMEKRHHELEGALLDRELRLKGAEEDSRAKSKQAYGGTVTNPKELAALEKKIEELGRLKDRLESEILELMDQVEASEKALAAQAQTVRDLETKVKQIRDRYAAESSRLKHEIADMKARREALLQELDPGLLKQYETIREKTGGVAVAAVRKGSCTECKVTLPSTYAPRLRAGDQIVKCESCHRILYLPPGESPHRPEEE